MVDLNERQVARAGSVQSLTPLEVRLLRRLYAEDGGLVPRQALLEDVWGYHPDSTSRAPYIAIQRLRAKLELDPAEPRHLQSVYGGGYRFVETPPASESRNLLPEETSSFHGREAVLAELERALANPGVVTLHGPGGMGKSRTLLRLLHLQQRRPGAPARAPIFVALEELSDGDTLLLAILGALGLSWPERSDHAATLAHLARHLRQAGPLLLVLDGAERLVDALVTLLQGLLPVAPELSVLVSSRVVLGRSWERRVALPPLTDEDMVTLFETRARQVSWGFRLGAEGTAQLRGRGAELLGGMPLAVELAAARAGVLSVEEILDSMANLVLQDTRQSSARHASLDAALGWSFDLLTPTQRQVMGALVTFLGPPERAALEQVAPAGAPVVEALIGLRDASLVHPVTVDGQPRFRVLAPVRRVARDRLEAELDAVTPRHQRWAQMRITTLAAAIDGTESPSARAAVTWERPDLLEAFEVALDASPSDLSSLALALDRLQARREPFELRVSRLARTLPLVVDPAGRVGLANAITELHCRLHRWDAARQAVETARESAGSDPELQRSVDVREARVALFTGHPERCEALLSTAPPRGPALLLHAHLHQVSGRPDAAHTTSLAALEAFVSEDDLAGAAMVHGNLALIVGALGDLDEAAEHGRRQLELAQHLDHAPLEATARSNIASVALRACRFEEAETALAASEAISQRLGDTDRTYVLTLSRAELGLATGELGGVVQLLEEAVSRGVGEPLRVFARVLLGTARHLLGDLEPARESLEQAWVQAGEMGLSERRAFAGLALAPLLAELHELDRSNAVLTEVSSHYTELDDREGLDLVAHGHLHLELAEWAQHQDPATGRDLRRQIRQLPDGPGLLRRRAQRLALIVAHRRGLPGR